MSHLALALSIGFAVCTLAWCHWRDKLKNWTDN